MKIKYNKSIFIVIKTINSIVIILSIFVLIGINISNVSSKTLNLILIIVPIFLGAFEFIISRLFIFFKFKNLKKIHGTLKSKYFFGEFKKLDLRTTELKCKINFDYCFWLNQLLITSSYFKDNGKLSSLSESILKHTNIEFEEDKITINYRHHNSPKDSDKEQKGMNQHYGNVTVNIWTANFNKVRNIDINYVNDFVTRSSFGEIEIPLEQFEKKPLSKKSKIQ